MLASLLSSIEAFQQARTRIASSSSVGAFQKAPRVQSCRGRGTRIKLAAATESSSLLVLDGQPIQTAMAPMVAASDFAFRRLTRQYGCDLCYTQMLHAKNLLKDETFCRNHLDFVQHDDEGLLTKSQENCLAGMPLPVTLDRSIRHDEGGPLVVQLAGHDPHKMIDAAQLLLDKANDGNTGDIVVHGIDVNLGCPQGIAKKGGYGAFLLEQDEDLACRVLSALRQHLPSDIQVSAKIRLPLDSSNDNAVLKTRIAKLLDSGIDFLTIHGRTLEENKTKVGPVNVDRIRLAVETAQRIRPNFPVICNGGVEFKSDVQKLLQETGATTCMSSEALLERPNVFVEENVSTNPRALLNQQLTFARDYIGICAQHPPLPGVLGNEHGSFNIVRGHLFKMLHRYLHVHADLRNRLASHDLNNLRDALDLIDDLEKRYQDDAVLRACPSGQPNASWYRRHWKSRNVRNVRSSKSHQQQQPMKQLSVAERKEQMQARIEKMRIARIAKQKRNAGASSKIAL